MNKIFVYTLLFAFLGAIGHLQSVPALAAKPTSEFARYPLWSDVPVRPFSLVSSGYLGSTKWAVYVYRPQTGGKKASESPCLFVASITGEGDYGSAEACGRLAPADGKLVAPVFPLTTSQVTDSGRTVSESLGAVTLGLHVSRVAVHQRNGSIVWRVSKHFGGSRARHARVKPFRYVVFALRRLLCVDEVVGYNYRGDSVLEAPLESC